MVQTLSSPRSEHARNRFMAAVALERSSVVSQTHSENRLIVCILGTHYGILAEIADDQIALSIKAPGHPPQIALVADNDDVAIDAAVHTVFTQIAGRLHG